MGRIPSNASGRLAAIEHAERAVERSVSGSRSRKAIAERTGVSVRSVLALREPACGPGNRAGEPRRIRQTAYVSRTPERYDPGLASLAITAGYGRSRSAVETLERAARVEKEAIE